MYWKWSISSWFASVLNCMFLSFSNEVFFALYIHTHIYVYVSWFVCKVYNDSNKIFNTHTHTSKRKTVVEALSITNFFHVCVYVLVFFLFSKLETVYINDILTVYSLFCYAILVLNNDGRHFVLGANWKLHFMFTWLNSTSELPFYPKYTYIHIHTRRNTIHKLNCND